MANGGSFVPTSKYSSPVIESQVTLHTEQAKRIFRRCFEGASRALFTIDVIARALAEGNKAFDHGQAMEAINSMLSAVEKEIVNASGRYQITLKSNGQEAARPNYSNVEVMQFSISTPEILRFATILSAFDEMIVLFDTCWLCGLVDSKKAQATRTEKLRMMMKIVRKLQLQATSARKGLQKSTSADAKEVMNQLGDLVEENEAERISLAETNQYSEEERQPAVA